MKESAPNLVTSEAELRFVANGRESTTPILLADTGELQLVHGASPEQGNHFLRAKTSRTRPTRRKDHSLQIF